MVEKIRVSLWDIFSFFLTGLLTFLLLLVVAYVYGLLSPADALSKLAEFPTALSLLAGPLVFTLAGMIVEPFANYFDKYVLNYILGWAAKKKEKHSEEEEILKSEIKARYLGSLNGKIENPYSICKEYVETKQLSTTFMVYLSRYGFYRNCAFLAIVFGAMVAPKAENYCVFGLIVAASYLSAAIMKRRSEDFYSFMAPAVYRAFLIDKNKWVP